jgi:hypothetical protein
MLHRWLLVIAGAVSAVAGAAPRAPATAPAADGDVIEAAAEAIAQRWPDARVLVLGELHGTQEAPALAAALARRLAGDGPLLLGVEIPQAEQDRLDAWLVSDGAPAARAALLAGEFWQRAPGRSDGRRSQAMLALLEALRRLRSEHPGLRLLAFDRTDPGATRDASMAQVLRTAHAAAPAVRLLVLTGNYHARLRAPHSASVDGKPHTPPPPMAGLLDATGLVTIDVGARRGAFWACMRQRCGPHELQAWPAAEHEAARAELREQDPRDGYHARLELPRYRVSPPVEP